MAEQEGRTSMLQEILDKLKMENRVRDLEKELTCAYGLEYSTRVM